MVLADRDTYLRKYLLGALSGFLEKGINYTNIGEIADILTEAAMESERKWQEESCCEQLWAIEQMCEDVPQ